jgi:hypothetical protein
MRAWQLAAAFAGSRQALEALLRDDRLTHYLGAAEQVEQLLGPGARRRLDTRLPDAVTVAVLSDTPVSLPTRSAAADWGWRTPTPWRPPPDPLAVLRSYLDRLSAEVESTGGTDRSNPTALSSLAWLVGQAVGRALTAILLVCLAPLTLAISALLSLGVGRARRQGMRRIRRTAGAIGAADGHLMERQRSAGVFGEGPYLAVFTTLRAGTVSAVAAAVLERAISAGSRRDLAVIHDWGFSFPRDRSRPELSVQVVGEGQLFAEYASLGYPMHQVRGWRDASPVLVQAPVLIARSRNRRYPWQAGQLQPGRPAHRAGRLQRRGRLVPRAESDPIAQGELTHPPAGS